MEKKKKKLLMIASSGGHLEEVLALKALGEKYETVLITEKTKYDVKFWQDKLYLMPQVNRRELKSWINYIGCFFKIFSILRKEKPDAVLSTGAMIAYPALLLAKLMRIKTIFVECMFNVYDTTLTARLSYPFVDLFIVQWEELLKIYPKAIYRGRVF